MKKILFVASECVPFIKTGGLADVVGSLPQCLDKQYFDCRVVIPKYMCIPQEYRDQMEYVGHFYMDMAISVKSFEFISHNLPILTTDVPAMARFVRENKCGIVCKDNPASIKEALLKYYSDEDAFREMKCSTYEAAINNTWEKRVEKIATDLMSIRS